MLIISLRLLFSLHYNSIDPLYYSILAFGVGVADPTNFGALCFCRCKPLHLVQAIKTLNKTLAAIFKGKNSTILVKKTKKKTRSSSITRAPEDLATAGTRRRRRTEAVAKAPSFWKFQLLTSIIKPLPASTRTVIIIIIDHLQPT